MPSSDNSDGWLVVWASPAVSGQLCWRWFRHRADIDRYVGFHVGPPPTVLSCLAGQAKAVLATVQAWQQPRR